MAAGQRAARRPSARARPHDPLPEHLRYEPRRRLRRPKSAVRPWPEVRDAPTDELEESIRRGGLAPTKAPRIQAVLRELGDPIDLDWLAEAPREEALAYLTALPGVGRKTAACVMIFSFDRPEIPVDTHVHRVGGRLGLFRSNASWDEAHDEMLRVTPARGRVRAPRESDPPRPRALPARPAEMRRVRAASDVPLRRRGAASQRLTQNQRHRVTMP